MTCPSIMLPFLNGVTGSKSLDSRNDLHTGHVDNLMETLKKAGYEVTVFRDATGDRDTDFGGCTPENYLRMRGGSVVYVAGSHGGRGYHSAVYAPYTPTGKAAIEQWCSGRTGITLGTRYPDNATGDPGYYYAQVFDAWLRENWKPQLETNRAVVLWNTCHSAENDSLEGRGNVMDAAGGRWRLGFGGAVPVNQAGIFTHDLVGEMLGDKNLGVDRTAGGAFDRMRELSVHLWSPGVTVAGRGNPWTTLGPSPLDDPLGRPKPAAGSGAPAEGWGCFLFDTYVDFSVPAAEAVASILGRPAADARWIHLGAGARGVGFRYDRSGGMVRLRFDPQKITGEGGGFPLMKRKKRDPSNWNTWTY